MFRRPHHRRVAEVLSMLDAPLLAEHNCWFGGGTAIVLANGEFRESVDIDFLVSDPPSYRQLRQIVRVKGPDALATRQLELGRTPSVDGYGIRTSVLVAGVAIKFEIIHEVRLSLDTPSPEDEICGVRTLTRTDQVARKLLASDDRWADTSTFSRDLIDLAMMKPDTVALKAGAGKAVEAYGKTVGESLNKAVAHLRDRPQRLDECIRALQIDAPRAVVWQSIRDFFGKVREDRKSGSRLGLALGPTGGSAAHDLRVCDRPAVRKQSARRPAKAFRPTASNGDLATFPQVRACFPSSVGDGQQQPTHPSSFRFKV